MTIGERLHEQREQVLALWLEEQGLSLHRQGGLYQIMDSDLQPVTELCPLVKIIEIVEAWGR